MKRSSALSIVIVKWVTLRIVWTAAVYPTYTYRRPVDGQWRAAGFEYVGELPPRLPDRIVGGYAGRLPELQEIRYQRPPLLPPPPPIPTSTPTPIPSLLTAADVFVSRQREYDGTSSSGPSENKADGTFVNDQGEYTRRTIVRRPDFVSAAVTTTANNGTDFHPNLFDGNYHRHANEDVWRPLEPDRERAGRFRDAADAYDERREHGRYAHSRRTYKSSFDDPATNGTREIGYDAALEYNKQRHNVIDVVGHGEDNGRLEYSTPSFVNDYRHERLPVAAYTNGRLLYRIANVNPNGQQRGSRHSNADSSTTTEPIDNDNYGYYRTDGSVVEENRPRAHGAGETNTNAFGIGDSRNGLPEADRQNGAVEGERFRAYANYSAEPMARGGGKNGRFLTVRAISNDTNDERDNKTRNSTVVGGGVVVRHGRPSQYAEHENGTTAIAFDGTDDQRWQQGVVVGNRPAQNLYRATFAVPESSTKATTKSSQPKQKARQSLLSPAVVDKSNDDDDDDDDDDDNRLLNDIGRKSYGEQRKHDNRGKSHRRRFATPGSRPMTTSVLGTRVVDNDETAGEEQQNGYDFGYTVLDEYAGTDFSQWERREPGNASTVTGQYQVRLPDGRTQTVVYNVNSDTGYRASVTYEGVPRYPEPPFATRYDSTAAETSSSN